MAKPDSNDNNNNFPEKQTWGTWEELLLTCAVHRYGTDSWGSVATEIQKRTANLRSLSPLSCQQKYLDLKRRFSQDDAVSDETAAVPWLEELRKLRVAELKSEVERYDLSISSLQMKVKRLEEERERNLREENGTGTATERPDLEEEKERNGEPAKTAGEPVPERPNRSVNESNSTDLKNERADDANPEAEAVEPETGEEEPVRTGDAEAKPLGGEEDSCRGSCDSVAKESERVDPGRGAGDSPESVAESKGGEESSDVQSSASLPRKKGGVVGPDEPDKEDRSPVVKRVPVESQPLAHLLEIVQSHSFGSLFSRRLQSQVQEAPDYTKLIRQHVDLETIRTRLEEGWYSGSNSKFFRDLLLLATNASVFYGKGSSEFIAAGQLRELVLKEMPLKMPKRDSPPKEQSSIAQEPADLKPDPKRSHPLSLKPRMSVPLIACRKRSSLAARSSTSASGPDKSKPQTTQLTDEKSVPDVKEQEDASDKDEEPQVTKKRTRERSSSSTAKKANSNAKSRSNTNTSFNVSFASKGQSSNDSSEAKKADQDKKAKTNANSKKQSAASFLKRMKRGSSSDDEFLIETVKSSAVDSPNGKGGGTEQKKNNSSADKGGARKGQSSQKQSNAKKQANAKGSSARRSASRQPKRGAAPSSPVPSKRGREAGEKEAASAGRAKKRPRR